MMDLALIPFVKASMVSRSLCAQYEFLCTKHAPRFLKKLSVSYIKLLLIPATILKHGWTDELSIDSRMKAIWGAVGVTGGAGGNPEEWAIIGYLRSLALLEARYDLDEENRRRAFSFNFNSAQDSNFITRFRMQILAVEGRTHT